MTAPIEQTGYASVEDYELRTGFTVPPSQVSTVQQRLNDVSALMGVYMGDCAEIVESTYPDVLTSLTCSAAQRSFAGSPGIRSESVGSTSVSYLDTSVTGMIAPAEAEVLDALMAACCPDYNPGGSSAVGQIGVSWGGGEPSWAADVDMWVVPR